MDPATMQALPDKQRFDELVKCMKLGLKKLWSFFALYLLYTM